MNLQQLFQYFHTTASEEPLQKSVKGLSLQSQSVQPGFVFFAIRGHQRDGHDSIPEAIRNGAIAIVCSDPTKVPQDYPGVVLHLQDVRGVISLLAARFYHFPSRDVWTVGVTGTNGKTSITFLTEWLLNSQNQTTAVMGTIDHHMGAHKWPTELTTPDPILLQSRLQEFKKAGAHATVMEVSSHSLDQKRVEGVDFDVAVFTNLSRDHLDYHKTMKDYHAAKQRLFTDLMWKSQKAATTVIINSDDSFGRAMKVSERARLWTYGQSDCDFRFEILNADWRGTEFQLQSPQGLHKFQLPLLGLHNVYNAVAALAILAAKEISLEKLVPVLEKFPGVPGRLQKIPTQKREVFVDYAHSPDALEKVLEILVQNRNRLTPQAKIWTVFGCGGDRDAGKRPLMAAVAERFSDHVIVTSDNPRTENPQVIIDQIKNGFQKITPQTYLDRRVAIREALHRSHDGDVILIAGKGHENYQILGHEKIHFSDSEVVLEEVKK